MLFINISVFYAFSSTIVKILGETNEWNFNAKKNARVQRKVKCKEATRPDLDTNYQRIELLWSRSQGYNPSRSGKFHNDNYQI